MDGVVWGLDISGEEASRVLRHPMVGVEPRGIAPAASRVLRHLVC